VKFDANACIVALQQHLLLTLKLMQKEYLAEARSHMRTPEGAESLHDGDIEMLAGWIAVTVVGGAWAAMDEFGTGSLMDRSNPFLDAYRQGELWNPYRGKHGPDDTAIRSRQAGPYTNIFGEQAVSRAPVPGFNLERLGGKYAPQPPSHAMRTAARWMMAGRAEDIWRKALAAFPWGRFIIATPD
jgi:hypothetical protein